MSSLPQEYKIVEQGVGFFSLLEAVLCFKGSDCKSFLQGILSNDIKKMKKEQILGAFHLTAKGKWVAALKLFEKEEGIWALTSVAEKEALQKAIKNLIMFSQTELFDFSEEYSVIMGIGKQAFHFTENKIPVEVIRDSGWIFPTILLLVSKKEEERILKEVTLLSEETFNLLRIESKIPVYGIDVNENTIPLEAGLDEDYISYSKGCYVGQEVISRIKHYGKVNKVLVKIQIQIPPGPPLQRGENKESPPLLKGGGGDLKIFHENKEVGKITSFAFSPARNSFVALAILPRDLAETGKKLEVKTNEAIIPAAIL